MPKIFTSKSCFITVLIIANLMSGCDSFGPDAIRGTHPLYNDAIVGSMNEQFIQNIVRLHYRDPVFFLDVASVTASLKLEVNGGFDQSTLGVGPEDTTNLVKYSLGAGYTTSPTISYAPLQGEAFVKTLFPLMLYSHLLAQAGMCGACLVCVWNVLTVLKMPPLRQVLRLSWHRIKVINLYAYYN